MALDLLSWVLGLALLGTGSLCLWLRRFAPEISPLAAWGQGAIAAGTASIGLALRPPDASQWLDAFLAVPAFVAAAALIAGLLLITPERQRNAHPRVDYLPALAALTAVIANLVLLVFAPQSHAGGVCGLLALFLVVAAKLAWRQSRRSTPNLRLPLVMLAVACVGLAVALFSRQSGMAAPGLLAATFIALIVGWLIVDRLHERLRIVSQQDPLTGLSRQGGIDDFLVGHFAYARAESVVLLKFDIDHLRTLNMRYGHDAGDRVLRQVAQVLRTSFRAEDCIARVTGQQFLVACVGLQTDVAHALAERARQAVRRAAVYRAEGEPMNVSVSVGVSSVCNSLPACGPGWRQADSAMYRAKSLGRNLSIAHWVS